MADMSAYAITNNLLASLASVAAQPAVSAIREGEQAVNGTVRVFGVEDDPLLRMLLSTKFDMSSVQYDFSEDGLQVADRVKQFRPTVILLDIMIGAVNGLDILEEIKQNPELQSIPVIVFSNQDSYEERKRAQTLGASDYLVKATTDLSDLVRILGSHTS